MTQDPTPAAQSWKVTLPCTRAEAEALDGDIAAFALMEHPPVLMTSETQKDDSVWRLDAYFEAKPDAATIAAVRALIPSARDASAKVERIGDQDWVTLSQSGLAPVRAGRFFIHTGQDQPLTEPGIGSDARNVETKAEKSGSDYLITGHKKWISFGQKAALFLVIAQVDGKPSAFLVERGFRLSGVIPGQASLEEYFFKVTGA